MKIILDTNVFISGIFFAGPQSQTLKAWENQRLQIVLSSQILSEYQRVAEELSSKYKTVNITPVIDLITIHSEFIDTQGINISVCEDPDDNKFLECAVASSCRIIISGDKHLLELTGYEKINVLNARTFVEKYL